MPQRKPSQEHLDVWRAKDADDAQLFWLGVGFFLLLTPVGWIVLVVMGVFFAAFFR